jgi:hypothetical protein
MKQLVCLLGLVWAAAVLAAAQQPPPEGAPATACPRCGWRPPQTARSIVVKTVGELERAVRAAREGDEILLADGRYSLQRMIEVSVPNVTIRGQSGDPARVVLHGRGMRNDPVGVGLAAGASGITIADLTIRSVGYHAVQVRGENGASDFTLHNAVLEDTGQQLLKGSAATTGPRSSHGLVACSEFRYTTSAPSDYTNGVDILRTSGWVIRDNRFFRIRGPSYKSGPAILVWRGAEDTIVERNVIVDSFRGIALGLDERALGVDYDHLRGVIRHNVVLNLNIWADEAIEANGARSTRIEHNTVVVGGGPSWAVAVRFPTASAEIRNNLLSKPLFARDGGVVVVDEGNVVGARPGWFVDAGRLDFHLSPGGRRALDAGVAIAEITQDFARAPRTSGKAPDAGALETAAP